MKNSLLLLITLVLIITGCNPRQPAISGRTAFVDSTLGFIIADTIIYDVNLVNHNPDDSWATQRLKNLDLKLMIDNIYDLVYSGNAYAYNHTTGEKLTVKEVEELEKTEGFSRENVDMVQFKEIWFMNPTDKSITKKVIAVVLGTQVYDSFGQYLANRAIMRIEFGTRL